nr:hypothetical protein [Tanacetum cinerariifolium]
GVTWIWTVVLVGKTVNSSGATVYWWERGSWQEESLNSYKSIAKLINLKSKKVGEDTNFIVHFEFCGINKVVSILPFSDLFSCERDGGGFHYFLKLYGFLWQRQKRS